jgi:hypothetical protein
MANWAYIQNQVIIETLDELPKNWKNISNLDALENNTASLKSLGWYPIHHNNVDYNPTTQKLKSLKIQFDGISVYETYTTEDLDTNILYNDFSAELRTQRDKLLQESDFMCLYDIINSKGQEWATDCATYRQTLRDLPDLYPNDGNVYTIVNVIWPTKPDMKNYPKNNMQNNEPLGGTE